MPGSDYSHSTGEFLMGNNQSESVITPKSNPEPQDELSSLINTLYGNKANPTQIAKIKQMAADPNYLNMLRNQAFAKNNPGFDANAGRQEAYDKRWSAYKDELFKNKKFVNTKKAQRVFDEQFSKDWNAGLDQRRQDYINKKSTLVERPKPSLSVTPTITPETVGPLKAPKLTLVPPKPKVDWNARAAEGMGAGTTKDDVLNWQKYYNSLNSGKKGFAALSEDGLFGQNTKTAYDAWKNSAAGKQYNTMTAKGATWDAGSRSWKLPKVAEQANQGVYDFGSGKYISNEEYNNGLIGVKSENTPPVAEQKEIPTFQGADSYAFEYTMQNDFDKLYNNHLGGKYKSNYHGIDQVSLRKDAGYQDAWNAFRSQYQKGNIWMNGLMNHYTRLEKGGNINKFNNGGKPMNQKQMEEAFVQFLIQDAQAHGIDPNDQQALQQYIQSLGKEGLAAKQKEFMQRWEGTPSRKLGGHLAYLSKLKGNCPDGEEMVYMENGGRVCPKCVKKAKEGKKVEEQKMNAIQKFKAEKGIKVAKKDIDKKTYQNLPSNKKTEADEHYLGKATSDNKDGSYNISHKPNASDSTYIDRKHMSPNMQKKYPKKACGDKLVKRNK